MKLKLLISILLAAVMSAAMPVWAHGGHDRVVIREFVEPVPVYRSYYSAPAPGLHIVVPDIYIPLR